MPFHSETRLQLHLGEDTIESERKARYEHENKSHSKIEYPHIVKVDGVLGGEAIIEGTRIGVWHIVGYYYKVGMSVEDILAEWGYLNPAAIFSALGYYHDHKAEIDRVREENSYERWQQEHLTRAAA